MSKARKIIVAKRHEEARRIARVEKQNRAVKELARRYTVDAEQTNEEKYDRTLGNPEWCDYWGWHNDDNYDDDYAHEGEA